MRARDVVLFAVAVIAVVTVINLLTGNKRITSTLPISRLEHARQESLSKPFHLRAHRLERSARLEGGVASDKANDDSLDRLQRADQTSTIGDTSGQIKAVEKQSGLGDMGSVEKEASLLKGSSIKSSINAQISAKHLATHKKHTNSSASGTGLPKYHVVASAGEGLYLEWQVRLCYFSYLRMKELHPDSAMGGFTRLLHTGKADHLMKEIPTIVVEKLSEEIIRGYQVINRPYAFHQWVHKYMADVPEDYILMAETDHVFIKPPLLWASPTKGAAFPFWYIQADQHATLLSRFNEVGAAIADMATIGNSPTMLHKSQMTAVVDVWYPLSIRLKTDPEADKELGWILDMYAWSMASAQAVGGPVKYELHKELMLQPPFDTDLSVDGVEAYIVHLTYGMDFDLQGKMSYGTRGTGFHFDKRDYTMTYPPRNLTLPANVNAPAIKYVFDTMNEAAIAGNWPSSAGPQI